MRFTIGKPNKRKCKCFQNALRLEQRDWIVNSYYPTRVWGRAKKSYDGRKLLKITCSCCNSTFRDYNRNSKLWKAIDDDPYKGNEKIVNLRKEVRK